MKLITFIFIVGAILPIYGQEKSSQPTRNENRTQDQEKPANPFTGTVINQETTNCECYRPDDKPKSYISRLIGPENLPNIGLCIVGAIGIALAVGTLKAVRRQSDLMQRQSGLLIERERPRIFVKFEQQPEFETDEVNIVRCKVECLCPTPAFVQIAEIEAWVETKGVIPSTPISMPMNLPSPVKETVTLDEWTPIFDGEAMTHGRIEQIKDGNVSLYCRGRIEYRGLHLLPEEPAYRTHFQKKWTPQFLDIPTLRDSGYWNDYPDAEANRST